MRLCLMVLGVDTDDPDFNRTNILISIAVKNFILKSKSFPDSLLHPFLYVTFIFLYSLVLTCLSFRSICLSFVLCQLFLPSSVNFQHSWTEFSLISKLSSHPTRPDRRNSSFQLRKKLLLLEYFKTIFSVIVSNHCISLLANVLASQPPYKLASLHKPANHQLILG